MGAGNSWTPRPAFRLQARVLRAPSASADLPNRMSVAAASTAIHAVSYARVYGDEKTTSGTSSGCSPARDFRCGQRTRHCSRSARLRVSPNPARERSGFKTPPASGSMQPSNATCSIRL